MQKNKTDSNFRVLDEIESIQSLHRLFFEDLSPNTLLFFILNSCFEYKKELRNKIEVKINKDNSVKIFIKSTNILDKIIAESEKEYNKMFAVDISTCLIGININKSYRKTLNNLIEDWYMVNAFSKSFNLEYRSDNYQKSISFKDQELIEHKGKSKLIKNGVCLTFDLDFEMMKEKTSKEQNFSFNEIKDKISELNQNNDLLFILKN
ncbi:MAG: hypothetical protein CL760_06985 [Chloroflexi bacterium]|nr:hypothetical protein [Chloroflexota bacterium]|tara:strand:- start:78373 stop:78993 length:621 start_codon:yes stop_codon:yes gene_type:complete